MSRHASRFNKRDANEPEIIAALDKLGCPWIEAGPLDGWTVRKGRFVPVECKMPGEPLTDGQHDFITWCEFQGWPYLVLRSVEDAIAAING